VIVIITKCAWCGKILSKDRGRGGHGVSHGVCTDCKKKVLDRYDFSPDGEKYAGSRLRKHLPSNISKHIRQLDEQLVTEEIGLEDDIEGMIRQIRFIGNKNEKLFYIKVARRVIALLLENRFTKLTDYKI